MRRLQKKGRHMWGPKEERLGERKRETGKERESESERARGKREEEHRKRAFGRPAAASLLSLFDLDLLSLLFLSLSLSLCCLLRHHCDTTVMVRCDMLSSPRFWSPHMSPLFLQSMRALSLFLSLFKSFSLSLFLLSLYFSSLSLSLSVACRVTTVIPL